MVIHEKLNNIKTGRLIVLISLQNAVKYEGHITMFYLSSWDFTLNLCQTIWAEFNWNFFGQKSEWFSQKRKGAIIWRKISKNGRFTFWKIPRFIPTFVTYIRCPKLKYENHFFCQRITQSQFLWYVIRSQSLFRIRRFVLNESIQISNENSKFAMFMKKENPLIYFQFSFWATLLFLLWMP